MRPFLHAEFACRLGLSPRPWGLLLCSGLGHRSFAGYLPHKGVKGATALPRVLRLDSHLHTWPESSSEFTLPSFSHVISPPHAVIPELSPFPETLDWSCLVWEECSSEEPRVPDLETNRWIGRHLVAGSEHGRVGVPVLRGIWKGRGCVCDFILSDVLRFP